MFKKPTESTNPNSQYYTVFDTKTGIYKTPFLGMNDEDVLREFKNMMCDAEQRKVNTYYLNSEDYQIFKIGSWDNKNGIINPYKPHHVTNLHEVRVLADILFRTQQNGSYPVPKQLQEQQN